MISAGQVGTHRGMAAGGSIRSRRGVALAAVLIMSIAMMALAAAMLQSISIRHRQIRLQQHRHQASWLVEAGLDRAIWQLRVNPEYRGETWQISADRLGSAHGAEVMISIQPRATVPGEATGGMVVSVQADYPAHVPTRVRRQKSIVSSVSPTDLEDSET